MNAPPEFWWTGVVCWVCFAVYSFAKLFVPSVNELGFLFEILLAAFIVFVAATEAHSLSPLLDTMQQPPSTPNDGRSASNETAPSPPDRHGRDQGLLDTGGTEFAHLRPLLTCDGPYCGRSNPKWRCADCHMAYYCSRACQRDHWTAEHSMHCEQQQQQQQQPVTGPNFLKGALSRYQNGQYDCSVYEAHLTLDAQRATPGAHKIVAMALLAMAKQQKSANTLLSMPRKDGIQIYYGTLDCVIEVVYKGFVYEEQWNDHNTSINRDFLQELCDLKAPGVSIIQDSGGGQLVRDTNRSNKTKGNKKRY